MNKLLYQIHRWGGVALAVFMLGWFATGLVIMYAPSSALQPGEQLAGRDEVRPSANWLSLEKAWAQSEAARQADAAKLPEAKRKQAGQLQEARLVSAGGNGYWLVENAAGQKRALDAVTGQLHTFTAEQAVRIGERWVIQTGETEGRERPVTAPVVRHVDTGPQDSAVRNHDALRPFHRLEVGDSGRELLVSARTGEVVRDSTPWTRASYWAGNWIHLLRPLDSIGLGDSRRTVLTWLAGIAFAACVTGLIIGWQRWRPGWGGRPTYSKGRKHPYRDVWNTWHFWTGLIGGIATTFWALSGYLNNNPFELFSQPNPTQAELVRYRGGPALTDAARTWQPARSGWPEGVSVVEVSWRKLGDEAVLVGTERSGSRHLLDAEGAAQQLSERSVSAASARLLEGVAVNSQTLQTTYDSYYYPRHDQGLVERPLPVWRVDLSDAGATRLYIDPVSGRILLKQDTSRRVYRWLYSALHHWDFGWLYHRPVWDGWMLLWVGFGLVLAGASVVLAYKRLELEFKTWRKRAAKRRAQAQAAKPSTNGLAQTGNGLVASGEERLT